MTVVAGIVSAFVGAAAGAVGAYWFAERSRRNVESSLIVRNYLVQLQDSLESLWHRLFNLGWQGGGDAMATNDYYESSTIFVVATVLGQSRRLTLDGVYGHLEAQAPGTGQALEAHLEEIEAELGELGKFQRYYRRELGDLTLDWSHDHLRPVSYGTFRDAAADDVVKPARVAASAAVRDFESNRRVSMLNAVDRAAQLVSGHTGIEVSYSDFRQLAV